MNSAESVCKIFSQQCGVSRYGLEQRLESVDSLGAARGG